MILIEQTNLYNTFIDFKMNNKPSIRFAHHTDLPTIVDIYNQAIRSGNATGDTETYEVANRIKWFEKYDKDSYPIYVAELENKVVAYCTLSPYRPGRKAMSGVAEVSYYLDYDVHGKGIGTALLQHAMADCPRIGKKNLLAILLDINVASIGLLEKCGFEKWGHFPNIINLNGKICGQVVYGRHVA